MFSVYHWKFRHWLLAVLLIPGLLGLAGLMRFVYGPPLDTGPGEGCALISYMSHES